MEAYVLNKGLDAARRQEKKRKKKQKQPLAKRRKPIEDPCLPSDASGLALGPLRLTTIPPYCLLLARLLAAESKL
jgi:hypothetical protein